MQSIRSLPKISVVIRKRPLTSKETRKQDLDIVTTDGPNTVIVNELRQKLDLSRYIEAHTFNFDRVFNETTNNEEIYNETIKPLILTTFEKGTKVTCFAYGQTGGGKTYTTLGEVNATTRATKGMYALAAGTIFDIIQQDFKGMKVSVSFYEIYCGQLYDLLNERRKLPIREDSKQAMNIVGLVEKDTIDEEELMFNVTKGQMLRIRGETAGNDESSRSHAILTIMLKAKDGKSHGKITFIDLAGSERAQDTIGKQTKFDGAEINKSLLALKECIRAIDQDKKHMPFRGSKLTMVLKDSLTGRGSLTVMIGAIAPTLSNCEHTLNTLRYAERVKEFVKDERTQSASSSKFDKLSSNLMLSRQSHNVTKVNLLATPEKNYSNSRTRTNTESPLIVSGNHFGSISMLLSPNNQNLPAQPSIFTQVERPATTNTNTHEGPKIPTILFKKAHSTIKPPDSLYSDEFKPTTPTSKKTVIQQSFGPSAVALDLQKRHSKLVQSILEEEEVVIEQHREHVDTMVSMMKLEVNNVKSADTPQSNLLTYVENSRKIFMQQIAMLEKIKEKFDGFREKLLEESDLIHAITQNQNAQNTAPVSTGNITVINDLFA